MSADLNGPSRNPEVKFPRARKLFEALNARDPEMSEDDWKYMGEKDKALMEEAINEVFPLAVSEKAIPQPIETAPKDKNGVLAYSPKFYQGKGGWVAAVWLENGCASAWHSNPGGWRFDPTHWLPMPKVPTECERPEC